MLDGFRSSRSSGRAREVVADNGHERRCLRIGRRAHVAVVDGVRRNAERELSDALAERGSCEVWRPVVSLDT